MDSPVSHYDRLSDQGQRLVDQAVSLLYQHLRQSGVELLPDHHVLPISDYTAKWIIDSQNGSLLRLRLEPPEPRRIGRFDFSVDDQSAALMEWWRVRFGYDPVQIYTSGPHDAEERED